MTLSEVFYEAACRMSQFRDQEGSYSCCMAELVAQSVGLPELAAFQTYDGLMSPNEFGPLGAIDVWPAAREVKWTTRDYRTWMLLMASEAVK